MRWTRRTVAAGLALGAARMLTPHAAQAQKPADTLRIAWIGGVPTLDPYYNQQRVGLIIAHHAFDGLVHRDPVTFAIKPLLASAWRAIDDTTIEFDLRQNVTFHDGSRFSADDVVYTFNTIMTDPAVSVPSNYQWLSGTEKIDDYKIRLKLKRIFPAALEYLAMVMPIWPKASRTALGATRYAMLPIGCGPYRITSITGQSEIELARFGDYYPESPKAKPSIARLSIRAYDTPEALSAAIDQDRADWSWGVGQDEFARLSQLPGWIGVQAESMRVGYLSLDAAGRTGADNPLTKLKTRQAIFHAIDRSKIVKELIAGGARVADAPCYPTQFGCDANAAVRYAYDPALAKALLAEAGYPNGFETDLVSYVLPSITTAVQTYLKAVGITVTMQQLPISTAIARSREGRSPLDMGSWGSYSINDVTAILPYFFTFTDADYVRDAELKSLVEQGGANTDVDARRKFYRAAVKLITEKAYWLPLHTYATTYVYRRDLTFKPFPDELPRFYLASWK